MIDHDLPKGMQEAASIAAPLAAPPAAPRLVITRPESSAQLLADALHPYGIASIVLPALDIVAQSGDGPKTQWQSLLALNPALVIFVSPAAVRCFAALMPQPLPANLPLAAIGPGTAEALHHENISAPESTLIVPSVPSCQYDAKTLWMYLQQVWWPQRRPGPVVLVKGQGGSTYLQTQLAVQGAIVHECQVYERQPARWSGVYNDIWRQLRQDSSLPVWLLTSRESYEALRNRHAQADCLAWFESCPMWATHVQVLNYLQQQTSASPQGQRELTTLDPQVLAAQFHQAFTVPHSVLK